MSKHFNFAVDADGIALVTMDSPGRSMNVFHPEVEQELAALVERAMKTWTDAAAGQIVLARAATRDEASIRVFFVQSDTNYGEAAPRVDSSRPVEPAGGAGGAPRGSAAPLAFAALTPGTIAFAVALSVVLGIVAGFVAAARLASTPPLRPRLNHWTRSNGSPWSARTMASIS